jgi:hypothetical protein
MKKPIIRLEETKPYQRYEGRKGEQHNPPAARQTTNRSEHSWRSTADNELESLVHIAIIARPMMTGK